MQALTQCTERPYLRISWMLLAQECLEQKDYLGGLWASNKALAINNRHPEDSSAAWDSPWVYDMGGTCAFYAGCYKQSLKLSQQAWEMAPDDRRLIGNLKLVRRHQQKLQIYLILGTSNSSQEARLERWMLCSCHDSKIEHHPLDRPVNEILKNTKGLPGDIIVIANNVLPPDEWDTWIYNRLDNHPGALRVNAESKCEIYIMDYAAYLLMNRNLPNSDKIYYEMEKTGLLKEACQLGDPSFTYA